MSVNQIVFLFFEAYGTKSWANPMSLVHHIRIIKGKPQINTQNIIILSF